MDGVIILNTIATPIYSGSFFGFWPLIGIVAMIIGIITTIALFRKLEFEGAICCSLLFIAGLIVVITTYSDYGKIENYDYTYEVVIEDTVSFNDFYDMYDIIDQRGEIYTITPKNQE